MEHRQYLATPRKTGKADALPTARLLEQFARAATHITNVTNLQVKKTSVVFSATPEALDQLEARFGATFIIEPERYLNPLGH
jgi:hypothetical protein